MVAPIFEFLLPQIFVGGTLIFDLPFEAPVIFRHLAQFHGDRSMDLEYFALKCKKTSALNGDVLPNFVSYIV